MKRYTIFLICLCCINGMLHAQKLIAVQNEKGKYGYVSEDGTVIVKFKYDEATPFKDGLAKIGKDGKYSLINEAGEIITKQKYTYIGDFYNGVCPVADGGSTKKGVMFASGGVVGNEATTNNGEKWGLIDKTGKEILKPDYEAMGDLNQKLIYILKGDKFGFINGKGEIIIKPQYNYIGMFNKQGICWVNEGGKYNKDNNEVTKGKFGIINESGRVTLPVEYEDVGNFPLSQDILSDKTKSVSGFPHTPNDVKMAMEPKGHQNMMPMPESNLNYIYFTDKKSQGLADIQGNIIIPLTKEQAILPPTDKMLRLAKIEKKKVLKAYYDLDTEVTVRIPNSETGIYGLFNHNLAIVTEKDGSISLIDKKGQKVIKGITKVFDSSEGYRVVRRKNMFGAIDSTGTIIIPIEYTNMLTQVSNGRLGAQKGKDWFFVDTKGNIVSEKYDRIGNYHNGYAAVCRNKQWGTIDLSNNIVVPLEWQGVAPVIDPQLIWVKKDNHFHLYDSTQKRLRITQTYDNASNFENGMAYAMTDKKWGIIDTNGNVLVPCLFEKETDMVYAKKYMLETGLNSLTETQALRVIARFDPETNKFRITAIIPDKHWDY